MRHVAQQDASGCGAAVLAMLLDIDYFAARELADSVLGPRDWALQGMRREELDRCLLSRRCELEHRRLRSTGFRDPWPPDPFAPRHYAYAERHFVAIEEDGSVLKTYARGRTGTTLTELSEVKIVVGVWA